MFSELVCYGEVLRLEFDRGADMREKIRHIVSAGVEVELVSDVLGRQLLIELLGAAVETVVVAVPAIEVDVELAKRSGILPCQRKRAGFFPMRWIDGITEDP